MNKHPALSKVIRKRLPGSPMLYTLSPHTWDRRYGVRVALLRIRHHLGIYFLGGSRLKQKRIAALRPPYPVLYHITPAQNIKSILEKGLVSNRNKIWLTDWLDPRWQAFLMNGKEAHESVCFRVDAERLICSGHKIDIINLFHVFITDHVPPECLALYEPKNSDSTV